MLKACLHPVPENQRSRMTAFAERRAFLLEKINAIPGMSLAPPMGAFYAMIDVRPCCERLGVDDFAICKQLLEQQLLALVPGSAFAAPGFVRASYAASIEMLEKAVARLEAWATNT